MNNGEILKAFLLKTSKSCVLNRKVVKWVESFEHVDGKPFGVGTRDGIYLIEAGNCQARLLTGYNDSLTVFVEGKVVNNDNIAEMHLSRILECISESEIDDAIKAHGMDVVDAIHPFLLIIWAGFVVRFLVEVVKALMAVAFLDGGAVGACTGFSIFNLRSLPMLYKTGIASLFTTISLFWYDIKSFFVGMLYEQPIEVNDTSRRISSNDTRAHVATIHGHNHPNSQDVLLSTAHASHKL